MLNGTRIGNGLCLYYWLVLSGDETAGELFSVQTQDAATVVRLVRETVQNALPDGVHRVAVSAVRGDGSAFLVWSGEVEVASCACA